MTEKNIIILKEIISQSKKLTELIDYQDASVVSKIIIQKPTGNITLFAFDIEQGLSEHTAPFDALVFILEGTSEITISGEKHVINENEILIMPANKPHALHATKKFKMLLILLR